MRSVVVVIAAMGCTGEVDPADGTDTSSPTTPGPTSSSPTTPPDLGMFSLADPEGDLQLVAVLGYPWFNGDFAAYGEVINRSEVSHCFVDVTLEFTSNSGLPLGSATESPYGSIRRIDQDNVQSCIDPGETAWFDIDSAAPFADVGAVTVAFATTELTTFDPFTEVVVPPASVEVSEEDGQVRIDALARNDGPVEASVVTGGGFSMAHFRMYDGDRFVTSWFCYADDGTIAAGASLPIHCHPPVELGSFSTTVFSPSWED